jgi:ArsR family transcriptional regulator
VLPVADEIDEIQAGLLRTLASVNRLRILHALGESSLEVREIAAQVGISQVAASQHLAALRAAGLVEGRREGRQIRYRLADPEILAACALMRAVLVRRLSRLGDLATAHQQADPGPTSSTAGQP